MGRIYGIGSDIMAHIINFRHLEVVGEGTHIVTQTAG
jgi:hypothetical protein